MSHIGVDVRRRLIEIKTVPLYYVHVGVIDMNGVLGPVIQSMTLGPDNDKIYRHLPITIFPC